MPKLLIKNRAWIFTVSVAALISLVFLSPVFLNNVRNLTIQILSIPAKSFSKIGQNFYSKRSLYEDNLFLSKEIGELHLKIDQFRQLRNENERLRSLLKFKKKFKFNTVSAEVIARNPNDWIETFVINKGSADGVHKNAAVCSAKGLLGKVVELGGNTSSVMLVTHPSFKVGGMLRKTRTSSIVVGAGNGMAKMLYLSIDAEVAKGDTVITSGFSRIFPKGITIGEVIYVRKSRTGLYKYAIIKPSAISSGQEEVLCIK